ncbi:MAG: transglutaminase family protein [bacterium]
MRLEIAYHTRYDYNPPVRDGTTALRLRPVSRPGLTVSSASVIAQPGLATASYIDGWGSAVDIVECPGSHGSITFQLQATVETHGGEIPSDLTPLEEYWYIRDSERVRLSAAESLGWGLVGPSWTAVESALSWLPQRFVYEVGATDALTPIEQVIAQGSGVCQDFAHIYLALLRSWGLHARYVSGYFFSASAETQEIDVEAMHAWVEVFRGGVGWVGLDATNGQYTDERYVPVGYGRDYDDVRPVRGVIKGRTLQSQATRLQMAQLQQ